MMDRGIVAPVRFAVLFFLAAGAFACGDPPMPPPANKAPVAVGIIPPLSVVVGESETLDVAGFFSDPDGDQLSYGATSANTSVVTVAVSGSNVTATGVAEGLATVTVTATDPDGASASHAVDVTVTAANNAPVVVAEIAAQALTEGDTVTLDVAGNFSDPDADPLVFAAQSDDGGVASVTVDGSVLTIVGVGEGSATITVTATDPGGLSVSTSFAADVERANRAPVAVGQVPALDMVVGDTVSASVDPWFSDPDGDTLAYAAESSNTSVATASMTGSVITVAAVGEGSATITITATDPGGLSATQTGEVTVTAPNRAPEVVSDIEHQELTEGDTITLDVSANFSDPDGDDLAFTAESEDEGVASVSVDGSVLTIVGEGPGSAIITVTATDPGGLSVAAAFAANVAQANRAPEAVGEIPAQSVTEDESVVLAVSVYFTDPDGDELTYAASSSDEDVAVVAIAGDTVTITGEAAGTATLTVTATDPGGLSATQTADIAVEAANRAPEVVSDIEDQELVEGDTITLDVSANFSDPDGDDLAFAAESDDDGVASVSVDGSVLTIAGEGPGGAIITVTATDPGGLSVAAAFAANVAQANRAPEAVGQVPAQSVTEDESVLLAVSAYFTDPDGDELTYAASSSDEDVAGVGIAGDTVTITGEAAGTATLTVTATDPGGLSATQTADIAVEAANRSPEVVSDIEDQELVEGDTITLDVSANFSDPDGDALAFTAESEDDGVASVSVDGSVLTIAGEVAGSATITVTATDPGGLSVAAAFAANVTAANRAPEAVGEIPAQSVTEDESVMLAVSAYFSDPDDDPLTYAATSSDEDVAGVTITGDTVTITGVSAGTATLTVTATDPGGLSATHTADITVGAANRAPESEGDIEDQELVEGDTVTLDVAANFSDPDGDDLSFTAESGDEGVASVTVDGSVLTITGEGAGSATITVTATDPGGLSVAATFAANVAPANRAPEAVGEIPAQGVTAGEAVTLAVSAYFTDPDDDALTYAASSSDEDVAGVTITGDTVTITGVSAGTATLTVTATDPGGLSATQTADVTVTPANRSPEVVSDIEDQEVTQGEALTLDVAANFSDPDGDSLAFTARSDDDGVASVTADGSVLTITGEAEGSATITVTATDPGELSVSTTFVANVQAANQAPEPVGEVPPLELFVGEVETMSVEQWFSDPDGDTLTYAAESSDTTIVTATMSEDVITVTAVAEGGAVVTITATDPGGLSATQEAQITVDASNQSPELVDSIPVFDLFVDLANDTLTRIVLDLSDYFSDPDGDSLGYNATSTYDTVATVESVEGAVVTTVAVSSDTTFAPDTTTLHVTAWDQDSAIASQEVVVLVANSDYEPWDLIQITDTGTVVAAGLLTLTSCLDVDGFPFGGNGHRIHWTAWQVKKGTGWLMVPSTYYEGGVCDYHPELKDAPAGTYRLAGVVEIWPLDDPDDIVISRLKSANEVTTSDAHQSADRLSRTPRGATRRPGGNPRRKATGAGQRRFPLTEPN